MSADFAHEPGRASRLARLLSRFSNTGAILVGLSALSVSIYQSYLIREQQRMSVWPYLSVMTSNLDEQGRRRFKMTVQNDGVGPARLRAVELRVDGKPVIGWSEAFTALDKNYQSSGVTMSTLNNRVIPAGIAVNALILGRSEDVDFVEKHGSRLAMRICYCSIYDECYVDGERAGDALQKVAECPRFPVPFQN